MRDLHHLNPNQPCDTTSHLCEKCSASLPLEPDTKPEPEEIIALEPLEPPCPVEWLQPPDLPASKRDNSRLWYHVPLAEQMTYRPLFQDELGDIKHENKRRRMFLLDHLKSIDNPTVFQIKDAIARVEANERFLNPERATKRQQLFHKHHGDLYPSLIPPMPQEGGNSLPAIAPPMPNEPPKIAPSGAAADSVPSSAQLTAGEVV